MKRQMCEGRALDCSGRLIRSARVHDELWVETGLENPAPFIQSVRSDGKAVDLFSFIRPLPLAEALEGYHVEWENAAVICTKDFSEWWEGLPQESRKNVRRSQRRGVVVRPVDFDHN